MVHVAAVHVMPSLHTAQATLHFTPCMLSSLDCLQV